MLGFDWVKKFRWLGWKGFWQSGWFLKLVRLSVELGSKNLSHDLKKSIGTFDLTSSDPSDESSADILAQHEPRANPFDRSSDFPLNLFATLFLRLFQF